MTPSTSHLRDDPAAALAARHPAYHETAELDRLRAADYARLDAAGHIYLDYTGGGLYAQSQLDAHMALLSRHVFGNPHSHNPTSAAMTELVEQARAYVLTYFNADPREYLVIFTANASAALKLVGESYPFGPGAQFVLTADNHNSVNGIREFAHAKGAAVTYVPITPPELRLDPVALEQALALGEPGRPRLFAFPAQSNFSGVKHPLALVEAAQARGWDVLLDVAAFAPTNRLDLARCRPDFVSLSFYKMFGYPTGIGALIARRSAVAKLTRPWFAGGTVKIVSVTADAHFLVDGEGAFEDGTVNYLGIPAVEIGLRHLARIGYDLIGERVRCLTGFLLEELPALRHANGRPLVEILGPPTTAMRGGTLALKLSDPAGAPIDSGRVEELAAAARISLRTGCFCNPGCGEIAHHVPPALMRRVAAHPGGLRFDELVAYVRDETGLNVNSLRVSVGLVSNAADVAALLTFLQGFLDRDTAEIGAAGCSVAAPRQRDAA